MVDKPDAAEPPLAYLNKRFLKSRDGRLIRILAEYLEPAARLRKFKIYDTIVFFGSARSRPPEVASAKLAEVEARMASVAEPSTELLKERENAVHGVRLSAYYIAAQELARRITEWSKNLTAERHFVVCSGGSFGMMEAANRGASLARGKTVGLGIKLPEEEAINPYVSKEFAFVFHYFFMRKFWFVYPAKAMVILPGGFGTMDELFEILTLIQTRKPRKTMPVVLFGSEFWDEILNFNAMVRWGVISPEDVDLFHVSDSVDDAFDYLTEKLAELYFKPGALEKIKLT